MKFVKQNVPPKYHTSLFSETVAWCEANISPVSDQTEADDALANNPIKLPKIRAEYKEFVKDDIYRSIYYGYAARGDGWRVLGIHYSQVLDNAKFDLAVEILDDTIAVHYRLAQHDNY